MTERRAARAWTLPGRILLILFALIWLQTPAFAQSGDVQIQQLRIQVMPEFDDPRVLVIAQGRVNSAGAAPQTVTFRLPQDAQINQMASMDVSSGAIIAQPYQTVADETDAAWTLVSYTLESAHFFFEYYYDPGLSGTDKQFTYVYNSVHPVVDLAVEVQKPLTAGDFTLDPPTTNTRQDDLGLSYYQYAANDLAAGAEFAVAVSYTKTDPAPSVSRQQIAGMQTSSDPLAATPAPVPEPLPAAPPASGGTPAFDWGVFLLGGGAVLLLGLLAALIRKRFFQNPSTARPPRPDSVGADAFCRQCGVSLAADAHFCQTCGHPVPAVAKPLS